MVHNVSPIFTLMKLMTLKYKVKQWYCDIFINNNYWPLYLNRLNCYNCKFYVVHSSRNLDELSSSV